MSASATVGIVVGIVYLLNAGIVIEYTVLYTIQYIQYAALSIDTVDIQDDHKFNISHTHL